MHMLRITTLRHNVFTLVTNQALTMSWTMHLFDRLITAEAAIDNDLLITSNRNTLQDYPYAIW